ncbi:MAG: carbon-nitrogen hydrolase family protein, partial [Actinobacteria bacterium]|nr:carbon-nitrogen hydrolase family protein [Actinomycetota bacterium]
RYHFSFFKNILDELKDENIDIICFPEYFLQGFITTGKEVSQEKISNVSIVINKENKIINYVCEAANKMNSNILLPLIENKNNRLYNSTVLVSKNGEILGIYRKIHLCKSEANYLSSGNEFKIFTIKDIKVGIMICFDRQIGEVSRVLSLRGAELILNPSAGEYGEKNDILMRIRAYENRIYILFSHPKESIVVNPDGDIISKKGENEKYITREIDMDYVKYYRKNDFDWEDFYSRRRPELYKDICF